MSAKSKFQSKIKAIKQLGELSEKEALAFAKNAKVVRIKRKRLVLSAPKRRIIGALGLEDLELGVLKLRIAKGVKIEPDGDNKGTFFITLPPVEEKKKKKKVDKVLENV